MSILMLKPDKKEHLIVDRRRLGRGRRRVFISRKGQGEEEVTLMRQKGIKVKLQATKATGLISSRSPDGGGRERVKETEAINRLAVAKEPGPVPSARREMVGVV